MRKTRWLVVLCALALAGCAAKPQELIVGKWETTDLAGKVQTAEFAKDGTVTMPLPIPIAGLRLEGKYKFIDNDRLEFEYTAWGKTEKSGRKVAVTQETLTLTDDNGKTQLFKRAK
jgi:uncharacterized protein (TIGR03066 family)